MKFLYTGAGEPNDPQTKAIFSLGGYVSSSSVANDVLNEVFGEISQSKDFNTRYRLLAIKNILTTTVDNVLIKVFLNEDIVSELQMALIVPATNDCGDYVFEKITNQYAKPLYGDFVVVEDGLVLNIGTMEPDSVVGLWISRKIDQVLSATKSCQEIYDDYIDEVVLETEDSIQIDLSWTEAESISQSLSQSQSGSGSL